MKSIKITIDGESHVNFKEKDKRVNFCDKCSLAAECMYVSAGGLLCEALGLEEDEYFKKEKTENQKRIDAYTEDEYHNK